MYYVDLEKTNKKGYFLWMYAIGYPGDHLSSTQIEESLDVPHDLEGATKRIHVFRIIG